MGQPADILSYEQWSQIHGLDNPDGYAQYRRDREEDHAGYQDKLAGRIEQAKKVRKLQTLFAPGAQRSLIGEAPKADLKTEAPADEGARRRRRFAAANSTLFTANRNPLGGDPRALGGVPGAVGGARTLLG